MSCPVDDTRDCPSSLSSTSAVTASLIEDEEVEEEITWDVVLAAHKRVVNVEEVEVDPIVAADVDDDDDDERKSDLLAALL